MENTERQKFEESWKSAFEGAEMTPDESVWSNIDLKLDNTQMKRRVVYYQRIAAAAILFALLIGVGGITYFNSDNAGDLAQNKKAIEESAEGINSTPRKDNSETPVETLAKVNDHSGKTTEVNSKPVDKVNKTTSERSISDIASIHKKDKWSEFGKNQLHVEHPSIDKYQMQSDNLLSRDISNGLFKDNASLNPQLDNSNTIAQSELIDVKDPKKEEKKTEELIASLLNPTLESDSEQEEKKTKKSESLWLSVGAATGSYNPGSSSSSASSSSAQSFNSAADGYSLANRATPQSNRSSVGTSYSIGLSVGKKIADRWIVQTGLNYLSQSINYTSNFVSQSMASNNQKASVADYADRTTTMITSSYKVNSSMEFVSIPVQAGYLIIDKKIGLQLNAGIASDIFLRNTLKDQSGQSAKYSEGSGADSPYRTLNWSGLASTELSYKLAKQYRISLVPGVRYTFQPALKSQSDVNSNPLILDVGFRFRYIFQ